MLDTLNFLVVSYEYSLHVFDTLETPVQEGKGEARA